MAAEDSGTLPAAGRQAAADVPFSPETIRDALGDAKGDMEDCVSAWLETLSLSAALDGRLVMEIVLGPEGVQQATLVDVEGVPEPMLGCFGGVVYEVAWPLPEEPTTLRYPLVVTDADDNEGDDPDHRRAEEGEEEP